MSTLDDRGHAQHSLATPASQDTSVVATIAGGTVPKTAEELSLHEEDQVKIQSYLALCFHYHIRFSFNQDLSFFSTGGDGANAFGDDLDGAGGSISVAPGTPEYHKVRLEIEHIHVNFKLRYYYRFDKSNNNYFRIILG
jgi:hypothetical protein